jgi:hypothetical protein
MNQHTVYVFSNDIDYNLLEYSSVKFIIYFFTKKTNFFIKICEIIQKITQETNPQIRNQLVYFKIFLNLKKIIHSNYI